MKEMPNYVTKQHRFFFLLLQCYSYKSMQSCNILIQIDLFCAAENRLSQMPLKSSANRLPKSPHPTDVSGARFFTHAVI